MKTICALSSPVGTGAIAVIRVSGDETVKILNKVLKIGKKTFESINANYQTYAKFYDDKRLIDEVMAVKFLAPKSFTGEDSAEIYCHASMLIVNDILKTLVKNGCNIALRGEFSKRAFLNSKIDLVQAEAICDLINSQTQTQKEISLFALEGHVSKKIDSFIEKLVEINSTLLAYIDFPEEMEDELDYKTFKDEISDIYQSINSVIKNADQSKIIRDGIEISLIGKPNVGKSTIMNAIMGKDLSIVTPIAGTTRDVLSFDVVLGGIKATITDTAGVRETDNEIEKIGVKKAIDQAQKSDAVICVFDNNSKLSDEDFAVIEAIKNKKTVAVINKVDLENKLNYEYIKDNFKQIVYISALKGEGIDDINNAIKDMFLSGDISITGGQMLTNLRQIELLTSAAECLKNAIVGFDGNYSTDLLSVDISAAADALCVMTGKKASEQAIERIFEKFCVGK